MIKDILLIGKYFDNRNNSTRIPDKLQKKQEPRLLSAAPVSFITLCLHLRESKRYLEKIPVYVDIHGASHVLRKALCYR